MKSAKLWAGWYKIKMTKKFHKVMLIRPPSIVHKNDRIRRISTPLGLLYLAAVLRDEGYDVKILDSPFEGYNNTKTEGDHLIYGLSDEEFVKKVKEYNPDIVGINTMFSFQRKNDIHYCDLIKSIDENIPIVLGGVHASLAPKESLLNKSVDFVIIMEGEYRFLNLLDALNDGKEDFGFEGVAYKKNGEIKINPTAKRIDYLDSLPLPARDLINMEKYIEMGVPFSPYSRKKRVGQIITSRGCPFNCIFCSGVNFFGHKIRMRSVENILKEVDELVNKYNIQEIQFVDDNFTLDRDRAKKLFAELKKYNLSWCTPNGVMVQSIDKEMVRLMAESGAYQLTFAIESGSERVLKEIIDKKLPPKKEVKELVDECHKHNIQVHGFFIVGFPGETKEEIDETLQYPFDNDFDSVSFYYPTPSLGSRLYELCVEKGYLKEQNFDHVKIVEIDIPKSSPDFVMSRDQLSNLIERKAKEFHEHTKKRNPERWDIKHKQFLEKNENELSLIASSLHTH